MPETVDAALLLDRFVSASSSDDAVHSLEQIETALQGGTLLPSDVVQDLDVVTALVSVLGTGAYQATHLMVEHGPALVARIYLILLKDTSTNVVRTLLTEPSDGRLLEAAMDVAADASTHGTYPRVVALQLLRAMTQRRDCVKLLQAQWLQAPAGLHRLGDLFNPATTDEQVRNEALLLAATLAAWAAVSKIWMFGEVPDLVIAAAVQEGGLTRGSVTVLDCLTLVQAMVQHADAALADLVVSSPRFVPNLAQLLDLRHGIQFQQPPAPTATTRADDDLDELISSGHPAAAAPVVVVPWLTPSEETVISTILDILSTLMEHEKVQQAIWKHHAGVCSLLWEMALLTDPLPGRPYPCAVPSAKLQQRSLVVIGRYVNAPHIRDRHAGVERLWYIVSTGARGATLDEKLALSQASLYVLRRTITDAVANEMLMVLLAPPMDPMDGAAAPVPPSATLVPRALTLLVSHLQPPPTDMTKGGIILRKVALSGSLGALSILLTDEPRRSILLHGTKANETTPALLEAVLACLNEFTNVSDSTMDDFVPLQLISFVGQWVTDAPLVVQAVLSSSNAMALSSLFQQTQSSTLSTLTGLVLGLCMEYLGDESLCGGWTRGGILALMQQRSGVAHLTTQWEALKALTLSPWSSCAPEWHVWQSWYESSVLVVRKRVVHELTAGGSDSDNVTDSSDAVDRKGLKALQLLMAEQTTEMENLRTALAESQRQVTVQDKQLASWQQRAESNPTQLDEMLTEYSSKNSALEEKVAALEAEMRTMQSQHETDINHRDDAIATVRQELVDVQSLEAEACRERDALRDDMEAQLQAYTILEAEFQRLSALGSVEQTTETPAGDQEGTEHRPLQQPEGEESHQAPSGTSSAAAGSTEVATLRAENSRMRDEARAADEWMTMAVERMNASAVDMASLQEEIASLRAQLDQSNASLQATGNETAQRLTQETEIRMNLEHELSQKEITLASIQEQNEQLQSQMRDLSSEGTAKSDVFGETRVDRERLQSEVQVLAHQLSQQQDEIMRRDARIQELESLPSQTHGDSTNEGDMSNESEVAQWRNAYEEAQEWIHKAVAHNQTVEEEKASLHATISELRAQISDLEAKASLPMDGGNNDVSHLEIEIDNHKEEIKRLSDTISHQQEQLQSRLDAAVALENSLSELRAELDAYQESAVKDEDVVLLRSQAEPRVGDDSTQLDEYEAELALRSEQMKLLEEELDEVQASRKELLQKVTDLESIKIEAGTREEEIQALRARTAEAEARKEAIQGILDDLATEKEDLAVEYDKNQRTLEKIELELNQLKAGDLDTTRNSEVEENIDEFFQDKIHSLEVQMQGQRKEASGIIQQWEESYVALQSQHSEVETKLQASLEEIRELSTELQQTGETAETLRVELESALSDLASERGKLVELETTVQNLSDQLTDQERDASDVVTQWQESYDEAETKLNKMSSEYEALSLRLQETESALRQAAVSDTEVTALREQNRNLEEVLATEEQFASDAVDLWQESYQVLERKFEDVDKLKAELEATIKSLEEQLAMDAENADKLKEELEAKVKSLEEQLDTDAESANNVVLQWQQSYDAQVAQYEEVSAELKETKAAWELLRGASAEQVDTAQLQSTVQVLQEQLGVQADRIVELEAYVLNLQELVKDKDKEASEVSTELQRKCDDISAERDTERDTLLDEIIRLNSVLAEAQAKGDNDSAESERLGTEKRQAYESLRSLLSRFGFAEDASDDLSSSIDYVGDVLSTRWNEATMNLAKWEQRCSELSVLLQSRELELQDRSLLAPKSAELDEWPTSLSDLRAAAEIQSQLDALLLEKEDLVRELRDAQQSQYPLSTATDDRIESLEQQLMEHEAEARSSVLVWQESYASLQEETDARLADYEERVREVGDLKRLIEELTPIKEHSEGRIAELENDIAELRGQLSSNEEMTVSTVRQWETAYNDILSQLVSAQEENEELVLEREKSRANPENVVERSNSVVESDADCTNRNRAAELSVLLEKSIQDRLSAESELEAMRIKTEASRSEAGLLNVHIAELQRRLDEASESAPRQLQSKVAALEKRISEHLDKSYRLECELDQTRNEKATVEEKLSRIQDDFGSQLEATRSENSRLAQTLESQRLLHQEIIQKMEHDVDTLRASSVSIQREYDLLQVRLAEKEDELLEASDALQLHSTNQVSVKATDAAANVLREQILDLRAQVNADRKTISDLRTACKAAEEDAERHRSDLAALLGMADNEANRGAIDKRIMEATESFQRNERAEIESIKNALSRALQELAEARAAEKEVEERAANASHQAMLYEQEVVNAKSDFKFLTQTMDEMVESESAKRAALEYRISSLQNEQIVLTRYHATEIESMRNEISQLSMEKDRLFQALKESEKTKEVLIQATKDPSSGENVDPLRELSRLRVEKVQLLSLAAEDATRVERRLRETRAAAKASADADIILERELRISAEKSLESLIVEFAEFRDETRKGGALQDGRQQDWGESQHEIAQLQSESDALANECEMLRESLERTETQHKAAIHQLEEECRLAKSRASQLEREGRYEAEVRAEVARIQASNVNGVERPVVLDENPADEDRENAIAIKMYDELEKQKQAFKEERLILFELQAERDDLLALLAQHDLLKDSLKGSLAQHGGQQAVEAAIEEAEHKAKTQYGKWVRL